MSEIPKVGEFVSGLTRIDHLRRSAASLDHNHRLRLLNIFAHHSQRPAHSYLSRNVVPIDLAVTPKHITHLVPELSPLILLLTQALRGTICPPRPPLSLVWNLLRLLAHRLLHRLSHLHQESHPTRRSPASFQLPVPGQS